MMDSYICCASELAPLLTCIVTAPHVHARWLNTLSYLENCGARKIARCEHPHLVREEMLKHAAEEFRHAHYLKRQISRTGEATPCDFSGSSILGGTFSRRYLERLDSQVVRYLRSCGLPLDGIKAGAYLLVTYAIERRAQELYPLYDATLKAVRSKVTVRSIMLEEEEHLKEMERGLRDLENGPAHAHMACKIESQLCLRWIQYLQSDVNKALNA